MERKYLRTLKQVSMNQLWPPQGLSPDPQESVRHQAVREVLCCIPEDDYICLKVHANPFNWFIPYYETRGMIMPFPLTFGEKHERITYEYAKVLYLSPLLERAAWDFVVGIVAHELAHLTLGHDPTPQDYETQENEVFKRIREWGFEREAKKVQAVNKWRKSWENTYLQKLEEKDRFI